MKKSLLLILTLIISLLYVETLDAITGYTTEATVVIRSEPRVASETYVKLLPSKNTVLDVVSEQLYNVGDTNCNIGWYKINYEGNERYICGNYVSLGNVPDDNPSYNTKTYSARIYGYSIFAKTSPNSSSATKHTLLTGLNVVILGDKVSGSGCADGWYHIQYYKGETGYVCSTYVRKIEELTSSNAEYEEYLRGLGFPSSYTPYLAKLHEQHPNWIFNPIQTGLSWEKAVESESGEFNAIHKDFINQAVSEVYSKGAYREANWFTTTDGVNAFFLDPRNFLSEKFVFMFEALGYNYKNDSKTEFDKNSESTKIYYNAITSMLGSSFLNTDEYKYYYIEAGFTYNVSPIHLVARTIQEGASSESYPAVSGKSGYKYNNFSLDGYYNFYNIGAYIDNYTNSPVLRGLAYACGTKCGSQFTDSYGQPWDTREKAIKGGAQFISGSYIGKGQNTLYFQKFNTSPTSIYPTATHQYQANVTAPASEGIDAFLAYQKIGLVDSAFIFDIPVYTDMPSVVSLPDIANTTNTLKEIKVDGKLISGYNQDIVDYTVYVNKSNTTVNIEVTKNDETEQVTGIGVINLTGDTTEHSIIVTAENGDRKTYRLTLIKAEDTTSVDDILSNLSVKINGSYMNNISPETQINTIVQSIAKYSPNASVTVLTSTGTGVSGTTLLSTGQTIKIISPNGESRVFTIIVNGDTSGDGQVTILDLLQIQKHILGSTVLTGENYTAAEVSGDNQISILDLLLVRKYILGDAEL